jgi:molybdenum cofactor biosynthesis protein B
MTLSSERSFTPLRVAALTVSDTRTPATDRSGDVLVQRISEAGHTLASRELLRDDADTIEALLKQWIADRSIDVVISTGGTGITGRDVTPEAFGRVLEKEIEGFAELFRMISFQKIGPSAILSRAVAGVANGTYLFALPGSPGAVVDAWDELLRPLFDSRNMPCNLVDLMPRLRER